MLDAVRLERMGLPTVTLATPPFESVARSAARAHGLPDLPIVVIPHDYLSEPAEAIRAKIEQVLDRLLEGLFAPRGD